MRVKDRKIAWELVNRIFPTDYKRDEVSSEKAGYSVYRSTADGHYYDYICDLGTRLELNYSDGKSENIWIEEVQPKRFPTIIVGLKTTVTVFGDVEIEKIDETEILNCAGVILKNGRYEFSFEDTGKIVLKQDEVAYIRFENV